MIVTATAATKTSYPTKAETTEEQPTSFENPNDSGKAGNTAGKTKTRFGNHGKVFQPPPHGVESTRPPPIGIKTL